MKSPSGKMRTQRAKGGSSSIRGSLRGRGKPPKPVRGKKKLKTLSRLPSGSTRLPHSRQAAVHSNTRPPRWVSLAPVFITFLFYLPLLRNGFVNWDDPTFITANPHIQTLGWSNIGWMFSTLYSGNWIPLAWISLALDYALGGLNPWVYHLHSLLLHCANTFLVFLLSERLLSLPAVPRLPVGPTAFLTALLFGLHPLHVESVAWACEQRDVLCAFFYLLSLLFYLKAAGKTGWGNWPLWACLGSYLLALMSKPMAITLPLVLVLLDGWPLRRLGKPPGGLSEKAPFFLFCLAEAALAPLAQGKDQALQGNQAYPFDLRVMNAFHSLALYLREMALPYGLQPYYHFGSPGTEFSASNLFALLLVIIISFACLHWFKTAPFLATAWAYYAVTLLPVLGLVQTGSQAAADRFTYLPSLGPFLLASSIATVVLFRRWKKAFGGAVLLLTVLLGTFTIHQTSCWRNDLVFWREMVRADPTSSDCNYALIQVYEQWGLTQEGLAECSRDLVLHPGEARFHWAKGVLLLDEQIPAQAAVELRKAVSLDPGNAPNHYWLSVAYGRMGLSTERRSELEETVRLDPGFTKAGQELGSSTLLQLRSKKSGSVSAQKQQQE